jgi:hypothetical protein
MDYLVGKQEHVTLAKGWRTMFHDHTWIVKVSPSKIEVAHAFAMRGLWYARPGR